MGDYLKALKGIAASRHVRNFGNSSWKVPYQGHRKTLYGSMMIHAGEMNMREPLAYLGLDSLVGIGPKD
ncbi:polyketide synthase [Apiospora saccharicola]|uniref:Polyketide synthase n=1 Tax=Apiospora saccharicola TaxID=335842 RepID=A0ABR1TK86_9PEZI